MPRLPCIAALGSLLLLLACGAPEGRTILREAGPDSTLIAPPRQWRPKDGRDPRLGEVARLLAAASTGDETSGRAALELARAVHSPDGEAEDAVALAYLGAATAIQARWTGNPFAKLSAAREGVTLLDEAAERAPANREVRFLRATSTFPMPTFLGRSEIAFDDLAWLADRTEEGLTRDELTPRMVALIHLYHGIAREEAGDPAGARRSFEVAARFPQCLAGRKARERLAAKGDESASPATPAEEPEGG